MQPLKATNNIRQRIREICEEKYTTLRKELDSKRKWYQPYKFIDTNALWIESVIEYLEEQSK